ncbi:MAG: GDSL-type esterase/lipase family protein, partial [Planctomycetota bacterium]|nr:GDSL-type esterase/lipase family protein [Planctomycetota bacterium]
MNIPPLPSSLLAAIIVLSASPSSRLAGHGDRKSGTLAAPSASQTVPALKLRKGDHISYVGNTLADRMQHEGWLETLIHHRFPGHELVFRNLGFPGDEIGRRPRSKDFGTQDQWLTKMRTDVAFMFFGYNESFAGEAGLANFEKGFSKLLGDMKKQKYNGETAPQMVVFSPIAHEDLGNPDLPDGKENNVRIALYTAAMRRIAATHRSRFVDLFELTRALYAREKQALTMNGIHLTAHGNFLVGRAIDEILFGERKKAAPNRIARLREAVLDKNFHWWSRYRTVDGYNVYGGRSKLSWHGQSNADVMQREMEIFDVMTANRDERIWAVAKGGDLQIDDSNTPALVEVKTNRPGPLDGAYPFLGGEEAIGKMQIAQGMEVNLFASEEQFPELINPVQMAVDTDSRLWVAVWPTYPHWNPKEDLADKLVILPDENGDGKADRMITFADGLNSVTGFEFWGGGVLVAAAPEILFLKDTDGDDRADVKIRMLQGVSSADTHHTANALTFGPGGWLHWSRGVFHVTNMETPTGTFRSTTSGVYRFNPRTFEVEFHFPIGPNPHGDVFDQWGFQYATDGTSGTGSYIDIGKGHKAPKQLYVKRVRPVPATGILSSSHFPAKNDGNFLICNSIGFLGVLQHRFEYDGASISAVEIEPILVSSDPNFRPTDLEVGGDGALYVSDWANPLIGHMQHNMRDPNRDHSHGRIYRVIASGRPLLSPPKMMGKPIGEVLASLKSHENGSRYRARRELSGRNTKEVVAATEVFAADLDPSRPSDTQPLLEALWVHEEHRVVNVPLLKKALTSVDPKARAAAVRTLGHWGTKVKGGLSLVLAAARDEEPLVRAEAVKAAVNFDGLAAAEVVAEAAIRATDIELDHVIDYARRALSVDKVLSQAVNDGRKLSVAMQSYMLRNASNADLLKMDRNEAVDQAILSRAGIASPARLAAASRLAVTRSSTPLREVLKAARKLGEEDDAIAIDEISDAALELLASSEAAAKPQLEELAFGSEHAALRRMGFAGLLQLDPDAQAMWDRASESARSLRSLLEAVPGVKRKAVAEKIYARVRPLMLELPEALRGQAKVTEVAGVEVDV